MWKLKTLALASAMALATAALAAPPVDINSASAQALAEVINGVGLKRAEAIVEYREKNGGFRSVDDLTQVQGIGERIVEKSRDKLTVKTGK